MNGMKAGTDASHHPFAPECHIRSVRCIEGLPPYDR
jgi:hypothetical protein